MMEAPVQHYPEQAIMTLTYTEQRPGSSNLALCMRHLSARPITIQPEKTIGSVSAANIIPSMVVPKLKPLRKSQKWELMKTKQN